MQQESDDDSIVACNLPHTVPPAGLEQWKSQGAEKELEGGGHLCVLGELCEENEEQIESEFALLVACVNVPMCKSGNVALRATHVHKLDCSRLIF